MYEVFARLLDERHLKAADVCRGTGLPSSLFSEWKRGKSTPKADKLKKIADYFGVSVEFLMTGKEEAEGKKNPYGDLKGIYLSYAQEAQDSGIDPDDIRLAIDTIKRLRGEK